MEFCIQCQTRHVLHWEGVSEYTYHWAPKPTLKPPLSPQDTWSTRSPGNNTGPDQGPGQDPDQRHDQGPDHGPGQGPGQGAHLTIGRKQAGPHNAPRLLKLDNKQGPPGP